MKRSLCSKLIFFTALIFLFIIYLSTDLGSYLTLSALKENKDSLMSLYSSRPLFTAVIFSAAYITAAALSVPGATVLTLAAGAIFGLTYGTFIVSLSSTIGATLSFLSSRYLFSTVFNNRFKDRMSSLNAGLDKEGAFYLLTLRLVPVFPFFLVNLLMGLTSFPVWRFFLISQIGMLPGTVVYVNAGTELSKIDSVGDILSTGLFVSFALLGFLPLLSHWLIRFLRLRKSLGRFKKPSRFDYNLVVIGAGSAGLVTSYIAAAVKAKVALIEKHKMGGDCLNTGCVPSKALIRSAKIFSYFKRAGDFGLVSTDHRVNFQKVMGRVHHVIKQITPHDSVERYTDLGVDCLAGAAQILSPYEVRVNDRTLTTKNIVVATGARPFIPKLPGLELVRPLTSDNVWEITELPQKLIVLGGGPIGCELAQSFARLGSQVTVIEMAHRLLSKEDVDVSEQISRVFIREGIRIMTSHKALRIVEENSLTYLVCEAGGKEVLFEFDRILLALGRQANIHGFGLEDLSIEVSSNGTIVADQYMRTTNFPNIFVCGDVTGPYQFTHVASHQAWYAAVNALFSPFKKFKVDYRVIPWCTFCDPEVARVGLSEADAQAKKIPYELTKYGIDDLDRAIADSEDCGFVKVLTAPGTDKILGVTIVGQHAGEIITEYVTAMKYGLGLNKILSTIHIYPTMAEANKYAAGVWRRKNAPSHVLKLLQKFHQWRRNEDCQKNC